MPIDMTPEIGDKRPAGVKAWDKKFATRHQICGVACDKHTGRIPGFCERQKGHDGMHSHEIREGMADYDRLKPTTGHVWDSVGPLFVRHKRRRLEPPEGMEGLF